jgi:hypothetical protein
MPDDIKPQNPDPRGNPYPPPSPPTPALEEILAENNDLRQKNLALEAELIALKEKQP